MSYTNIGKYSFVFIMLFSIMVSAQDIHDIGIENVNRMKAEGKLSGNEKFTNRNSSQQVSRISQTSAPSQSSTTCQCWIPRDASWQIARFDATGVSGGPGIAPLYKNDDWSTAAITLPFNICFYGRSVNQIYINNNGNISIDAPYSTFTALSFPDSTYTMIAPFWGDVDTRGAGSGVVYYVVTPTHLIVQWENVGYYNSYDDKLNTFQLIVTDGADAIISPGQNVSFCYKDMQWTTGDASGGTNGFGGTPATVGVNQGNGADYIQFGLFDHAGNSYDGAYGINDGVDWLDNQSFTINACVSNANIPPVLNSVNVCDTIRLCENTTYQLTANYLSPEQSETTNINFFTGGMAGVSVISNTPGNTATLVLQIIGQAANLGFHTISVTAIDNGTPAAATNNNFVIEIMPAPLPSFTYSPASPVLGNTPVQFTNTTPPGSLLTWDFGDGSPTTTIPNPSHTFTNSGVYNVVLSAMFPNGCTTTFTQQITVTLCSPATFSVNNACVNSISTIAYTGQASALANYSWNFGGATVISGSGGGPYDISYSNSGSYSISLTVTELTCSSSVSMPVDIYSIPVSSVAPVAQLCAGGTQNITFDGVAGSGAIYTWNFGSGIIQSGSGSGPFSIQWAAAGADIVSLIVSENGCSDTSQVAVQINAIPNANFTLPAAACAGDIINAAYTGNASAGANYTWNFSGGNVVSGSGQGPYQVSWNAGGIQNVTLTVSENGCTSQQQLSAVDVTSIPIVSISPVPSICIGAISNNVIFTGTAGVNATYNWNFGNATVVSGINAGPYSLQWNNSGTNQINLSVTENGCSASSTIDVTVNPIPTSDFIIVNAACVNQPVNLNYSGNASSTASYNWVFGNGTLISGSGVGPYSVSWSNPGNALISLVVTENGCVSPQTDLQAIINPLPSVFAGNDALVCSGTMVSIGDIPAAGMNYSWSPMANISDPAISNPSVTPINNSSAISQDNYILSVTDANGCSNTDTVAVASYPHPVILFDAPPSQCIKENNFIFSAGSNIPSGVNYNWTFSPEATPSSSSQSDIIVKYSAVGTFPVMLTGDFFGCPAAPHIDSVTIHEMPVADFIPLTRQGCEPLSVSFTNLSTGNSNTYSWNFSDGGFDNALNANHQFVKSGIFSVGLSASNVYGCRMDTTYKNIITVFALPVGQFVPNPSVANYLSPIIQFQNYSTNVNLYMWDFGDSDTSTVWSPNHTYSDTGTYVITLMLVSNQGCVDTVQGVVRVEEDFSYYIPNAFTPNGDGVNDVFRGYGVSINTYTMNIYNRWGELLYTTNNADAPWDGKVNKELVENGVYVYRILVTDYHNLKHTFVGHVSVVR